MDPPGLAIMATETGSFRQILNATSTLHGNLIEDAAGIVPIFADVTPMVLTQA